MGTRRSRSRSSAWAEAPRAPRPVRCQPDLLVGFAQGGGGQVGVLLVLAAAGERDLAGVAPQVLAALGEHRMEFVALDIKRDEHARPGAPADPSPVAPPGSAGRPELVPDRPVGAPSRDYIRPPMDGLIVVDVQNDFCSGGALAVPDGDAVVDDINRLVAHSGSWSPRATGIPRTTTRSAPRAAPGRSHCVRGPRERSFTPTAHRAISTRSSTPAASRREGYSGFEAPSWSGCCATRGSTESTSGASRSTTASETALDARAAGSTSCSTSTRPGPSTPSPATPTGRSTSCARPASRSSTRPARRARRTDFAVERAVYGALRRRSPAAAAPARRQPAGSLSTSLNRVGSPRSAGVVYSHSTSVGPMSQPLRCAYISIVIAVHAARLPASSSCGLGP